MRKLKKQTKSYDTINTMSFIHLQQPKSLKHQTAKHKIYMVCMNKHGWYMYCQSACILLEHILKPEDTILAQD